MLNLHVNSWHVLSNIALRLKPWQIKTHSLNNLHKSFIAKTLLLNSKRFYEFQPAPHLPDENKGIDGFLSGNGLVSCYMKLEYHLLTLNEMLERK